MASVTNIHGFKGMNPEDMKKSYKRLALKLHPDVSGYDSTNDMKVLNGEFSYWYAISARDNVYSQKVNDRPESADYYRRQYYADNYVSDLSGAIEWLLNHNIYTRGDMSVEISGVFIWVYGIERDDKANQSDLKAAGFRFKMKYDEDTGKRVAAWYYTASYVAINSDTGKNATRAKYGRQNLYGHTALGSAD